MQNFTKVFFSIVLSCFVFQTWAQQDDFRYKLSSNLANKIDVNSTRIMTIQIVLAEQLDFSQWNTDMKSRRMSLDDEKKLLLQSLKANAKNTQVSVIRHLNEIGATKVNSHWIANSITCTLAEKNIVEIARRPDVKWIGEQSLLKPTEEDIASAPMPMAPNGRERGLTAINAHKMWELGYTGYGGTVLTADTGVDPTHPAISSQYRGAQDGTKSTWYSTQGGEARDCGDHGTHVTGTILGLDRATKDTIGVAFNARWIGAGILCGVGTEDNIGAFEWALNPDQDTLTVGDIPHVINNSWYDPSLNGLDCYSIYVPILEALEAAGVAVIFSAGNDGPDPSTITQPHNINISELNAFTIGALNGNNATLPIASFSSRGPSHCPGEGSIKIKPEVSAPGVNVRSCTRNGEYGQKSGTSMSSPHVVGAILLLREAFPYLRGLDFKEALYNSCTDLGEMGEDNIFGKGIINVFAAYEYLITKGNQPVDPKVRNDVRLLSIKHSVAGCDGTLYPTIVIENAGQDTLRTLDIILTGTSSPLSVNWTGSIAPASIQTLNMEPVSVPQGSYTIKISLENPNNQIDTRGLDNTKSFSVVVTSRKPLLQKIVLDDAALCDGGSIYLELPKHPDFKTKTVFFDQLHGGNELPSDDKLLLKAGTSTIYGEVNYTDIVGESPQSNLSFSDVNNRGIVFNTNLPIRIDSIEFVATQNGVRRFLALNNFGDTLYDLKSFIKAGTFRKKFNWQFGPGTDYKIIKTEGLPLGVNAGATFPILDKQGVITITGNTDLDNKFPYFYNMQVSIPEACGRIPYEITVSNKKAVGTADFEASKYELFVPNDAEIVLTNISKLYASSTWNMGEGTIYNTENTTHTFTKRSDYLVSLTIVDTAGCYNTFGRIINVYQSTSSAQDLTLENDLWEMSPNPTQDAFKLAYKGNEAGEATATIYDLQGKLIMSKTISLQNKESNINTSSWANGSYMVRVVYKTKVYQSIVVKL